MHTDVIMFTNNCGPYWSDGKFQTSVSTFATHPVSDFDQTCLDHDRAYALANNDYDLDTADDKFFSSNLNRSPIRSFSAYIVKYGNKMFRYNPLTLLGSELAYIYNMNNKLNSDYPKRLRNETDRQQQQSSASAHIIEPSIVYAPPLDNYVEPIFEKFRKNTSNKTKNKIKNKNKNKKKNFIKINKNKICSTC